MRSLAAFTAASFLAFAPASPGISPIQHGGPDRLTFTDANPAVLEYTAVGKQDSLTLVRQGF